MASSLLVSQLSLGALDWLCFVLQALWPRERTGVRPTLLHPTSPRPQRSREPHPCAGLSRKPLWVAGDQAAESGDQAPSLSPPLITYGGFHSRVRRM
jgi:hypothetical protein